MIAFIAAYAGVIITANGTIRMIGFDGAYQVTENTVIIKAIFPTLKNKGSKSEFISLTAAINDILKSQTIPLAVIIAPAYALTV